MSRRWKDALGKAAIALVLAIFIACVGFGVYCVVSRTQSGEYAARLKIALNAATLSNGVTVMEDGRAVSVDEDAFRKLYFYLSRSPATWLGTSHEGPDSVSLMIGDDALTVSPRGENDAVVLFTTAGRSFRMAIHDDALWRNLTALLPS